MTDTAEMSNIEAEIGIIGACLYDAPECGEAYDRLRVEHFHDPFNRALWSIICDGKQHNAHAVVEIAAAGGDSTEAKAFIADALESANTRMIPSLVSAVVDAALRRNIADLAKWASAEVVKPGGGENVLSTVERGCAEIARLETAGPMAVPVGLTALANLDAALSGEFRGTDTGLRALDHITGGIKREDVWIIGGRSSMGKSVVGLSLALGIARQKRGVMMFSLEMPTREVQARMTADAAHAVSLAEDNLYYADILRGQIAPDQIERARGFAESLADLPMVVTDAGGLTIDDIRRQGLRQVRAWERAGIQPGVILIDHLGLIRPAKNTGNKTADTSDTVNELKEITKRLCCPIIALAQVNRNPEGRADKRPTMGDLNWSGSIEQIADFVCLLYRQNYYDSRSNEPDEQARAVSNVHDIELLIQKNRSGPTCSTRAWIDVAANALRDVPEDRFSCLQASAAGASPSRYARPARSALH